MKKKYIVALFITCLVCDVVLRLFDKGMFILDIVTTILLFGLFDSE